MNNPDLQNAEKSLNLADQTFTQNAQQMAQYQKQITALQNQVASLTGRKTTIYANLHSYSLFAKDQKIPFQWIQPSNTGNTGGASPLPHGTSIWTTAQGQPTLINIKPVNIAPQSDNFFYYMVLPFPSEPPVRMRFTSGNYAAKSATDWSKSQQIENQVEYIGGGFQYTPGWSVNPQHGLQYYDKKNEKWVQFLNNGKPVMINMGLPTNWMCECSMDVDEATLTFEWIVIQNQFYKVGITLPAKPFSPATNQFSVSVQLDGQASASSYTGILDALTAEWQ